MANQVYKIKIGKGISKLKKSSYVNINFQRFYDLSLQVNIMFQIKPLSDVYAIENMSQNTRKYSIKHIEDNLKLF